MPFFKRGPDLKKLMEREDVQGLIHALRQASDDTRAEIIQILADIRDPRATEALLRELEGRDMTIRRLAAEALNRVDPERKYVAAIHLLDDMQRSVRTAAAGVLAALGNPKAIDALIRAIKHDSDPQARAAAAHAVGALHDRRGLNPLLQALEDADDRVRIAAANALATLGDRTALPSLTHIHEADPHPNVRDAAERAIAHIEGISRETPSTPSAP